jgi:hypothetical protein
MFPSIGSAARPDTLWQGTLGDENLMTVIPKVFRLQRIEFAGIPTRGRLGHPRPILHGLVKPQPSQIAGRHPGRNDHLSALVKADKAAIEKVVSIWGKQEAVCTVKPLLRCLADAPRLDVASD